MDHPVGILFVHEHKTDNFSYSITALLSESKPGNTQALRSDGMIGP
jgi:hypothetical protein